jgi:hypothetical protein
MGEKARRVPNANWPCADSGLNGAMVRGVRNPERFGAAGEVTGTRDGRPW